MRSKFFLKSFIVLFLLCSLLETGCSKDAYDEEPAEDVTEVSDDDSDNSEYPGDNNENNGGTSPAYHDDTLTVAQFVEGNFQGGAWVKGYIIGDCTVSFSNAEFEPPFTHPQALLLADDMSERDKEKILAIQLKSGSKVRAHMNLVDTPAWYGKKVVFCGYWDRYLGMAGMKDISAYPLYDP